MSIASRQVARNKHSPEQKEAYWSMRHKKKLEQELKAKMKDSLKKGTFAKDFAMGPINNGLIDF